MASATRFVVEGYEHVGGRLTATTRRAASGEADALRQAEAIASRLPGAAALKLVPQADAGTERRIVLGAFGDVPDEVAEGLAGG